MHSLHMFFHLVVGIGTSSLSEMLYSIARHDCSYIRTHKYMDHIINVPKYNSSTYIVFMNHPMDKMTIFIVP